LIVLRRPLALVSGLTLGDYLLWNWSLSDGHDVLALVSGLTLPPLAIACVWLLAVSLARLLARSTRRSPVHAGRRRAHAEREQQHPARGSGTTAGTSDQPPASATGSSARSPRKIAA
jgi:hypothetical protein